MSWILRTAAVAALLVLLPGALVAQGRGFVLGVVPNLFSNDVSVVETVNHTEIARLPVGPRPHYVAVSPDGQFAYVGEDGWGTPPIRINRINLMTLVVEDVLTIGGTSHLVELETSPDGRWLVASEIAMGKTYIIDTANWVVMSSIVLCPICDGKSHGLYSAPEVAFSADSSTLYAATGTNDVLSLVDLVTGTLLETRPAQTSGGSPYGDVERAPDGEVVLANTRGVRVFDIPGGTHHDLPISQGSIPDIALVPAAEGILVASGSITSGGDDDFLSLVALEGGPERKIPSSESLRYLRYNPLRHEVWASALSAIDAFDMNTFTRSATVPIPSGGGTLSRYPSFSPDGRFFYQPMGGLDALLVIDTGTKQVVTQVPVGTNPRTIRMQGDVSPRE